jgi:type II secretory pathway component PulK
MHSHFRVPVRRQRAQRSSALALVLFFISLLSILVIGFLASMRIETISSRTHLEGTQADIFANNGVSSALSQLYAATTNATWLAVRDGFTG